MKKLTTNFGILSVLIFCLPFLASAQSLWLEDFDGSNTTNPVISPNICPSPFTDNRDYFNIVCNNGVGCLNEINSDFVYGGASGQFFGARDIDSSPCNSSRDGSLSYQGIDISTCTDVPYFCFSIAETRNTGGINGTEWTGFNSASDPGREDTWDGPGSSNAASSVLIGASIDGGFFTPVTAFVNTFRAGSTSSRSDGRAGLDFNCNGISNDPGEPELTANFTKYCFELPGNGASLDLQIDILQMNTGGEDVGLDNFEVFCGTPTSGAVFPACTPYVAAPIEPDPEQFKFFEDFDGSNGGPAFAFSCQMRNDSRDYFDIMCLSGCSNNMNTDYVYGGISGNFFGARDMDGSTNNPMCSLDETLTASGIDISGSSATNRLYLCFDAAESDAATNNDPGREAGDSWDGNTQVTFSANIDGAGEFPVAAFADLSGSNSEPGVDTDCNGTGDGQTLSFNAQTYCFEINGFGNTLDLSIRVEGMNTGGEDIALDNIAVVCTEDLADLYGVALSQSCSAPVRAVPTMGEWALFILFLLIANLGALFIMAFQKQPTLATGNQTVSMSSVLRSASFDRNAFNNALKHAFGLAIVGFAIIYIGWGEIVAADFIGMALSIPLVAYFIHLFYTKE